MKQRKLTTRALLVLLVLLGSGYYLYPTFRYETLRKREERGAASLADKLGVSYSFAIENIYSNEGALRDKIAAHEGWDDAQRASASADVDMLVGDLRESLVKNRRKAIKRGLDLQGGMHLVLEVDVTQLLGNIARQRDSRLTKILDEVDVAMQADPQADLNVVLAERFKAAGLKLSQYFGEAGESDATVSAFLTKQADDAVNRSLEILENRIDQFGVSEPSIQKQGSRRIVLELPGVQDPARARDLIGRTAQLEFKLMAEPADAQKFLDDIDSYLAGKADSTDGDSLKVAATAAADTSQPSNLSEELAGKDSSAADTSAAAPATKEAPFTSMLRGFKGDIAIPSTNLRKARTILSDPAVNRLIPDGLQIAWSAKPEIGSDGVEYSLLYVLKSNAELTGTALSNAHVDISGGYNNPGSAGQPVVSLEMNRDGARKFSRVTGANVQKRLAIVLDNKVYMAPVIRSKIPNGRAIIEGLASTEEANDLAIVLRAGALPTSVVIEEERTVGPSLGSDSIHKGTSSSFIGFLLVVIFMTVYYGMSGMIANFALLLNILLLFAGLALFGAMGIGATLSLPGIAGVALTIGMAVDANVLIFERIREELETGKTVWHAISIGYDRAFVTILDSHMTDLISGLVLLQFGTGPVKGFAVTLCIGLVCNLFTAVFVTRLIYDYISSRRQLTSLSI